MAEQRAVAVVGNTAEAVEFLRCWAPEGPWYLGAFHPFNETREWERFERGQELIMRHWIEARQGVMNMYFHLNVPFRAFSGGKAEKRDIEKVVTLHVDLDVDGEATDEALAKLELALRSYDPPPTAIVDSGGGCWGLWRLGDGVGVNGDWERIEDYNRTIERTLAGGDHCHNIDRIARIPGTINIPGKTKLVKGRVRRAAKVLFTDWSRQYSLDDFIPTPKSGVEDGALVEIAWDALPEVDLGKLGVSKRVRDLISSSTSGGYRSRSEATFAVLVALARVPVSPEVMAQVMLTAPIGEHVREQGNVKKYLLRQIARAMATASARPFVVRLSDDAIAMKFTEKYGDELRYVNLWGHWLEWNGSIWKMEETLRVFDVVRGICREVVAELTPAERGKAAALTSAKTVASAERLARSDRSHAARSDEFDQNDWIFGNLESAIDLRTGDSHPPRREDMLTKQSAVAGPGGKCSEWLKFLRRVTNGDEELERYLQRVAGYCLTGSTTEHALFFLYGTGANGKGVFLNTLTKLWGNYGAIAPMELFMEAHNERHPTELAYLRGARLVVAQETESGRRWAEAKIKTLTGGDPITARFMRQDFFTFTPQFKLIIAGNHKPSLRTVDEAIRRRIHLIPFTVTIPEEERDPYLTEKLKMEWPGILEWAVEGCREWQRIGLAAPAAVRQATDEYLNEEDALSAWVEECCEVGRDKVDTVGNLWGSWRRWAESSREAIGSKKSFSQALSAKGYTPRKVKEQRGFVGLVAVKFMDEFPM